VGLRAITTITSALIAGWTTQIRRRMGLPKSMKNSKLKPWRFQLFSMDIAFFAYFAIVFSMVYTNATHAGTYGKQALSSRAQESVYHDRQGRRSAPPTPSERYQRKVQGYDRYQQGKEDRSKGEEGEGGNRGSIVVLSCLACTAPSGRGTRQESENEHYGKQAPCKIGSYSITLRVGFPWEYGRSSGPCRRTKCR
jgi:hypothetical protein